MVEKKILKDNMFLQDLPDPMLEKITLIGEIETLPDHSVLFEKGQDLTHILLLVSGTVNLICPMDNDEPLLLDRITPGRTLGISSLVDDSICTFSAVCNGECTIVKIAAERIHQLFQEDFEMGHVLMSQVVKLFKTRLERHTSQFLHALSCQDEVKNTLS